MYFRKKVLQTLNYAGLSLSEKCPNTEFFLVRIFLYRTEYGDLGSKSPYSVRIQENTDQKKLRTWTIPKRRPIHL